MGKAKPVAEDIDIEDDGHGVGEADVIALPSYNAIPEPFLPLREHGKKVYDTWCRNLIQIGALTEISRTHVENLATATDQIATSLANSKNPSRGAMELQKSATIKLERFIGSKPIQGPGRGENDYTRFGFAKRARSRRHGPN